MISALVFYFVVVCSPDGSGACTSPQYAGVSAWGTVGPDRYDVFGPYFSLEDCREARITLPQGTNPWQEVGESLCYAREVRGGDDGDRIIESSR